MAGMPVFPGRPWREAREADHVAPPPGVAGLAGLDAKEPGKPGPPPLVGPPGAPPLRVWEERDRALPRDVTQWSGPKVLCPRSLPVWKHNASPFLPSCFCSSHLPAALKSLPQALFGLAEASLDLEFFDLTQTRRGRRIPRSSALLKPHTSRSTLISHVCSGVLGRNRRAISTAARIKSV